MKKKLSVFLLILFIIAQTPTVYADEVIDPLSHDNIFAEANIIINNAIQQGMVPGLATNEISSLSIGNDIPIYEVTNNTITKDLSIKYYPVLDQDGIVRGLIIARLDSLNSFFLEYTTAFSSELNQYQQASARICFIFDRNTIRIFDGINLSMVLTDSCPDLSRGVLSHSPDTLLEIALDRVLIAPQRAFDLVTPCDPSVSGSVTVPIITQITNSSYCWACCAVSVGECINPSASSSSAIDIAYEYAGSLYIPMSIYDIQTILLTEYQVYYDVINDSLMMTTIIDEIGIGSNYGKPIIARVAYTDGGGHFIVVYGYISYTYPQTSYISIMDPLSSSYRMISTERVGNDSAARYLSLSSSTYYPTNYYMLYSITV